MTPDNEKEKFVLISFSEFQKLNLIAGLKQDSMIKVDVNDMLFLGTVVKTLSFKGTVTLFLSNDTGRITVEYLDGGVADAVFALDVCKQYYGKIDQFITVIF